MIRFANLRPRSRDNSGDRRGGGDRSTSNPRNGPRDRTGPRGSKAGRCTAAGQPLSWIARSGCQANPTQRLPARAWQDSAYSCRTLQRTTAQDVTEDCASRQQVAITPLVGQPLFGFPDQGVRPGGRSASGKCRTRWRAQRSILPSRDGPYAGRRLWHGIDDRPIHCYLDSRSSAAARGVRPGRHHGQYLLFSTGALAHHSILLRH